jgi:hypothetical protein
VDLSQLWHLEPLTHLLCHLAGGVPIKPYEPIAIENACDIGGAQLKHKHAQAQAQASTYMHICTTASRRYGLRHTHKKQVKDSKSCGITCTHPQLDPPPDPPHKHTYTPTARPTPGPTSPAPVHKHTRTQSAYMQQYAAVSGQSQKLTPLSRILG